MNNQYHATPGFVREFGLTQIAAYANSANKGFHDGDDLSAKEQGLRLSLIHSEASECLDAIRHGNPPSDHIPEFSGAEEELADIVIRCMDMAQTHSWRLPAAIEAKMAYNATRPHMHGGKKM